MTQVSTEAELITALAAQETEIVITANFNITQSHSIQYALTISSDSSNPPTLTKDEPFSDSIFTVLDNGSLTLTNIVLDGAKATHSTGSSLIIVSQGTLILDTGSVLQNNIAGIGGGVMLGNSENLPATLILRGNAVIRDNSVQNNGGGIHASLDTGSIVEIGGDAMISNNVAQNSGGGIYFSSNDANVVLTVSGDVKITGNRAGNGGGIDVSSGTAMISDNVEISDNTAGYGGGIALNGTGITVGEGVKVLHNTATNNGGGIYVRSDLADVVVHGLLEGNTALNGGGVYFDNPVEGSFDASLARFVTNTATDQYGYGGGIYIFRTSGAQTTLPILLNQTIFDANHAESFGGGLMIQYQTDSRFILSADGCQFLNNSSSGTAGGMGIIERANSALTIQNSTFSKNDATEGGGFAFSNYDAMQTSVIFRDTTFEENTARIGGAMRLVNGYASIVMDHVSFTDNSARSEGGAIANSLTRGTVTLQNGSNFVSNRAEQGGAINQSSLSAFYVTDSVFSQNTATAFGRDIYSGSAFHFGSKIQLPDGLFLPPDETFPTISQHLTEDSIIQLEASPYIYPFEDPVVLAQSTLTLLPQDAAAFRLPSGRSFNGWEARLSEDEHQVLMAPEIYAIRYENTLGAENPNPVEYTVVTPTILLTDLQNQPDYRFLGWFDAAEGGTRVTGIFSGSTGDRTLYAHWQNLVHTVTYYGNDEEGSPAENVPLPQSVRDGESVTLSDESPTRTGYLFRNWNTASDGTGTSYYPEETIQNVTSNVDLYAQWQLLPPSEYVLAYHPNDDAQSPAHGMPENIGVLEGDPAYISTLIPTRVGFTFNNWNTDPSGLGADYAAGDTIPQMRENVDLYAQWQAVPPIQHTLTYYGNDSGGSAAHGIPDPIAVADGQSVALSNAIPTRAGYRFAGWNTSADGSGANYFPGQIIDSVTADIPLHAQWQAVPPRYFRVCFLPNDCCACAVCGMPLPMSVRENESAIIPRCCPCLPRRRFVGWNTRADGSGLRYAPGQRISPVANLSLFAQWNC